MDNIVFYLCIVGVLIGAGLGGNYIRLLYKEMKYSRLYSYLLTSGSRLHDHLFKAKCVHYELVAIKHSLPRRFKDEFLEENLGNINAIKESLVDDQKRL